MKRALITSSVASMILQFNMPNIKVLLDNGYKVDVACNFKEGNTCSQDEIKKLKKMLKDNGVDYYQIDFLRSPRKFFQHIRAYNQIKQVIDKNKYNIIHCQSPMGGVLTRLAARKARKNGTRVIYTAHGFHFYKGAPLLNWMLFYPVEKYLAKYTDTLITINNEDYERAKKKFSKRCHDIQYVPGVGVDPKKFDFKMTKQEKHDLRASLGLKDDDFVMIFPAELSKRKNQMWLINTLKPLFDEHLETQLLLPGSDKLNGKCQKLAKKLGLEKQVHFLGFRKDIPELLKISNLAVSSSKQEGLPVNIIEAKMAGLPVVALECRGMGDILKEDETSKIIKLDNREEFKKMILRSEENMQGRSLSNGYGKFVLENVANDISGIYFRKKRVLHILASNKFSGAENVACTIIQNLKDEYDFAYCSPNGPIEEHLAEGNINFVPLKKLTILQIKRAIAKFNPDVIHTHDAKASVAASFCNKDIPIISHVHANHLYMRRITAKSILFVLRCRKFKEIVWISDDSFRDFIFKNAVKNKSIILKNVIDAKKVIELAEEKVNCKNLDLIYVGRLCDQKNPLRFIDIVKTIKQQKPNIKVGIVGDGNKREEAEKKIKEYKLENNITMFGFQKNPYPYMKKAKIFAMTSIYEGLPMVVLEAQALGLPVIAIKIDSLEKIVQDGINGFLVEDNKIFFKKVIFLLSNNKSMVAMSEMSIKQSEKRMNVNDYVKALKDVYNFDKERK